MKIIKYIYPISFILVFALATASCEGPTGPAGPIGPEGPQGSQGIQGEQGNANIMYSDWMDIVWHENSTDTNKEMAIHESRITADFLNSGGIVLMFLKIPGPPSTLVYAIPMLNGTGQFHFGFVAIDSEVALGGEGLQGLIFWLRSLDGNTPVPNELWMNLQVRYVLIPGSVNLAGKSIDLKNYDELVTVFEISD